MSYRGRHSPGQPEKPDEHQGAYEVSDEEFYRDFRDVANLDGTRPIVRQVLESHERIHKLEMRYYGLLAGLITGALGAAAVWAKGLPG
jgi:hypothetical protein